MAKWKIGKPIDIAPCRLCGSPEAVLWTDTGTDHFFIECEGCNAAGPTGSAYSAFDRWNHGELDVGEEEEVNHRPAAGVVAHPVPFVLLVLALGLILILAGFPTSCFDAADIPACVAASK